MQRVGFAAIAAVVALGTAGCEEHGVIASQATLSTTAGTVDVQCIDRTKVRIVGSAPAAGFTATVILEGPAGEASLVFENPGANDYKVFVHCKGGVPGFYEREVEDTTITL